MAVPASYIACHECDLLVYVPVLKPRQNAYCPRCNFRLAAHRPDAEQRLLAFSLAALICLVLAHLFPFLTLSAKGMEQTVTLLGSVEVLYAASHHLLAAIVFISTVAIPALLLCGIAYAMVSIRIQHSLPGVRVFLRWTLSLTSWNMAEIFLISILVSLIKVVSLADVTLGLSFWAYVMFTICMVLVIVNLDLRELWYKLSLLERGGQAVVSHE